MDHIAKVAARKEERQKAKRAAQSSEEGLSELGRIARLRPPPLIDPRTKLIVVFSPKSACSSVAIWFFNLIGHESAARDFTHSRRVLLPHRYRNEVYYNSALYQDAVRSDLSSFRLVRVVRDPFDRVTSSFREALRSGYTDKKLAAAVPGYDPLENGLSFNTFLDFLERENLTSCNVHHRVQFHPIEDAIPPRHVINVTRENLYSRLNEVEADLGLPRTDFAGLEWLHELHGKRDIPKVEWGADASLKPLTRAQAENGPWPVASALLSPEARDRIAKLYAVDVARYG